MWECKSFWTTMPLPFSNTPIGYGYVGKGKPFRSSARDLALVNKMCDLLIDNLGIPLIGPSSHISNEIKSIKLDNGISMG